MKKIADGATSSTTPYYVTQDGQEFTPSDIINGKIKLKGRKYKAKSLSEKIMDKDFGKVTNFGDNKKKK